MDINEVRQVEGMEDFEEDYESWAFVQLLNGQAAEKLELPSGTIVNSKTGEVICKKGEPLRFIPIKFANRWTIWENRKPKKFTYDILGSAWSDGSPILNEEVNWVNNAAPIATASFDVVIMLPDAKEPEHLMLSLSFTNAHVRASGRQLKRVMRETVLEERPKALRDLIFEISTGKVENKKGDIWQEFLTSKYVGKTTDSVKLLANEVFATMKDFNKQTFEVRQAVLPAAAEAAEATEVTEVTEAVTPEVLPTGTTVEVTATPKF